MRRQIIICLPIFIFCFAALGLGLESSPAKGQEPIWNLGGFSGKLDSLLQESGASPSQSDAFVFFSGLFLGTPYQEHTLIGGENEPERLVINLAGVDCFTFLDYLAALSLSGTTADLADKLRRVRYEKPGMDYKTRNHFFTQWIDNNREWLACPVFPDTVMQCEQKELNRKEGGSLWLGGIPVVQKTICYLPRKKISARLLDSLRSGDVIGLVTSLKGLDVTHVGMALRGKDQLMLRHASSKQGKVVDEDLLGYVAKNKGVAGLIVARPIGKR